MKRFLVVIFCWFSIFSSPALAQEFDSQRAYNDYLYTFNQYQAAHQEFATARSAYHNYQTLTAKNEARIKALNMLELRNEVIRTYLTALRFTLAETTGISDYEQSLLYLRLDDEIAWYQENRNGLSPAGSVEDLLGISNEAQGHYPGTEALAFETLGAVLAGKQNSLRDRLEEQLDKLSDKIDEIRQRGDKETAILERWLLEAKKKLTFSQEKQFAAQQEVARIRSRQSNRFKTYTQARFLFQESNQYLKEALSYLREIIREVKIAD